MTKPNSTFRLSKQTKTMMSFIVDDQARHQFKRMMIDAELTAKERPKSNKTDREARE